MSRLSVLGNVTTVKGGNCGSFFSFLNKEFPSFLGTSDISKRLLKLAAEYIFNQKCQTTFDMML